MSNSLSEADVAAVRDVWDAMEAANFAANFEVYFGHVTQDFVALDPRVEGPLRGRAASLEWANSAELSDPDTSFTVEEIGGSGDVAYLVFTFTGKWMEGGEPMEARGKGLSLFQRGEDGTWRMSHQTWNANP